MQHCVLEHAYVHSQWVIVKIVDNSLLESNLLSALCFVNISSINSKYNIFTTMLLGKKAFHFLPCSVF